MTFGQTTRSANWLTAKRHSAIFRYYYELSQYIFKESLQNLFQWLPIDSSIYLSRKSRGFFVKSFFKQIQTVSLILLRVPLTFFVDLIENGYLLPFFIRNSSRYFNINLSSVSAEVFFFKFYFSLNMG